MFNEIEIYILKSFNLDRPEINGLISFLNLNENLWESLKDNLTNETLTNLVNKNV